MKIDKILKDDSLKEDERMDLLEQLNNGGLQKRQKKSQLNDFKDDEAFISGKDLKNINMMKKEKTKGRREVLFGVKRKELSSKM